MANSKWQITKILKNTNIAGSYFRLSFTSSLIAKEAKPGQFLEVRIANGLVPFLRKPLSIHSVKGETIEILYEVVGEGTQILSKKKSGETLDIIGPLGNGFKYSAPVRQCASAPVLVAGGIGVAPLVFLAQKLAQLTTVTLIGTKTKSCVLCEKEFKDLGCEVKVATEDGSRGRKGFITDLLKSFLSTINYRLSTIYACGPKAMLKETAKIAARHKIPCQVLLEEYMACGIGACLGCAVKVRTHDARRTTQYRYKMVCSDGPVFNADEVIWE